MSVLAIAMALDAALGEPKWLWDRVPHPAVLMGRTIAWGEARFNTGPVRRLRGVVLILGLGLAAGSLGALLQMFGPLVEILVIAVLLAQRSLVAHVQAVADGLRVSLGDGRRAVAMIVGRDTARMDRSAVARAAIESAAENFSDGVVAPVFWYVLAGLPGLLIYKMVNTADSMIGYRTPRYEAFGWAAARSDDFLNLLPARLTAMILAMVLGVTAQRAAIATEAGQHRSPNAGWPEAAMARGLDVALSGPRAYDGEMREYPFVNPGGRREIGPVEIEAAVDALWRGWAVLLAGAVVLTLIV
ncbi:adenosylcobinamide-phosphate synthase CbiB [Roseovarius aestuariivivens]|uniref:adenosylcobinamide-phosphate synthase CbiB n=1 Tax=Roseovarius aestuariivivens TaxID=1888910 RepID=UPI00107FEA56|nr:adenosylcobinamide-phosphate synthase CbiB [Roseovarius aestuariivivens]